MKQRIFFVLKVFETVHCEQNVAMINILPMMSSSTPSSPTSQSCAPPSMYAPMRRCPVRKFKRTISNTSANDTQTRTKKIIMQSKSNSSGDIISQPRLSQPMFNDKPKYVDMTRRRVVSVSCLYRLSLHVECV